MKEQMEKWKSLDFIGYPDYSISSLGRVKSLKYKKEQLLKLRINNDGYYDVVLYSDCNRRNYKAHRLVAVAFLDKKLFETNLVVNHKDSNKLNNKLDNLEIVTQRQNLSIERVIKKNNKSNFSENMDVGVSYRKDNKKFTLNICVIKEKVSTLGYYKTIKNANIASSLVYKMIDKNYDEMKIRLVLKRFRRLYKIN